MIVLIVCYPAPSSTHFAEIVIKTEILCISLIEKSTTQRSQQEQQQATADSAMSTYISIGLTVSAVIVIATVALVITLKRRQRRFGRLAPN